MCLLHISHTPPEGLLEKIQSVLAMSVCETVVTIHLGLLDVYPSTCLRQMFGHLCRIGSPVVVVVVRSLGNLKRSLSTISLMAITSAEAMFGIPL